MTDALVCMTNAFDKLRLSEVRNYQNAMMTRAYALATTPLDDQIAATQNEINVALELEVRRKLEKWAESRIRVDTRAA